MSKSFTQIHTFNLASSARVVAAERCNDCGRTHRGERTGVIMTMGQITRPQIAGCRKG